MIHGNLHHIVLLNIWQWLLSFKITTHFVSSNPIYIIKILQRLKLHRAAELVLKNQQSLFMATRSESLRKETQPKLGCQKWLGSRALFKRAKVWCLMMSCPEDWKKIFQHLQTPVRYYHKTFLPERATYWCLFAHFSGKKKKIILTYWSC